MIYVWCCSRDRKRLGFWPDKPKSILKIDLRECTPSCKLMDRLWIWVVNVKRWCVDERVQVHNSTFSSFFPLGVFFIDPSTWVWGHGNFLFRQFPRSFFVLSGVRVFRILMWLCEPRRTPFTCIGKFYQNSTVILDNSLLGQLLETLRYCRM